MILSIIIPTYNEEEYLPVLLESIKQQDFRDYEIIVADANSKDNTVKIAEEYGCIVVEGGMPAVGRNNGAKVAKGEYLLFLDSDLKLTEDYLAKVIYEFKMERLGIAITQMKPLSKKTEDKILHDLANLFMISVEKIKPHGAGCYGIIAKRELHECCGGFDEEFTFGEDTEYIERLAKKERFKVLRNAKIGVSTRRLEEEGLATLAKQYGKSTVNDFLGIRTEASDLNYGFDHGKEHISKHKLDKIALESEKLDRLKNSYDESKQKINTAKVYLKKAKKTKIRDKKVIFYCICREGMGHAIRSSVIIDRIKDKYDVYIFSSDRAYKYLNEKCDIVYGVRSARKTDTFFKKFTAESFYKIMSKMGVEVTYNHADYRLMSKRALDALEQFKEVNLFLRGMVPMVGYKSDVVYYERKERFAGESKYPLKKMLSFAMEGITSLSIKPIRMITALGVGIFTVSIIMLIYFLIRHFMGATVQGWTSIVVSVWAIGGLQLLSIGVIGEYIGKIYLETKRRPNFIVETYLNDESEDCK